MYGTVAHLRVKAGMEQTLIQQMGEYQSLKVPGYVDTIVYRMDADSNEFYIAVQFADKAAYDANAQSAEQNSRYQQMQALLVDDPEWHDGEIIAGGR